MTEQQIQTKIIKYLESIDAYVVKIVSASKSGVPDLLCCYEGKFIAIEVKRPESRNTVSKLQSYNLDMVEKSGGISFVAWSQEYVEEQILALHRGEL
jgi:Holliday junction resolvase